MNTLSDTQCSNCKRPAAPPALKCTVCLESNARGHRKVYHSRIAAGLCGICGLRNASGKAACDSCREKQRARDHGPSSRCECGKRFDWHISGSLKCKRGGAEVFRRRELA